ncbi:MAG: MarR family transcriptional regulator [Alphaproteobacteria bacterium]|jgi:MarR family transcriptional regulator for hemolysin|nr:MarR family transcriptional regulator [Alphaproteobacteria bacterium]
MDSRKNGKKSDVREQFGFRLGRLARLWRARLDEKMRPHGLTQARWVVLMYLQRGADGQQQKALAGFIGIEGPTLVHILDKLESRGLIERRQDEADRRGKTVHLTDEGWRMIGVLDEVAVELRSEHLADVSDADLAHCLAVFDRIQHRAVTAVSGDGGTLELDIGSD